LTLSPAKGGGGEKGGKGKKERDLPWENAPLSSTFLISLIYPRRGKKEGGKRREKREGKARGMEE